MTAMTTRGSTKLNAELIFDLSVVCFFITKRRYGRVGRWRNSLDLVFLARVLLYVRRVSRRTVGSVQFSVFSQR